LSDDPHLVFLSQELEDHLPIQHYNIQRESVIYTNCKQRGGYSIPNNQAYKEIIEENKTVLASGKNWINDQDKEGNLYISFKPITDKEMIPFYNEVVNQTYHHGLTEDDEEWIRKYTDSAYKRLKVQSYILQPDEDHLLFLKGLYLACWGAYQKDLPTTVYHICNLTDQSYDWYKEGMIFITPAFVSTSKKSNLNWSGNTQWEISLTKGKRHHAAYVKAMSVYPSEEEVLISCCTRFIVLSKREGVKEEKERFAYYIKLEFLDL